MPSERESEVARRNGAKSRGPVTAAGKANSSRNALIHGLTASRAVVLDYERREDFHQLLAEYRQTHRPATPAEHALVDRMAAAQWRIQRLWTIETALLDTEIVRRRPRVELVFPDADEAQELALAFRSLADESRALALATRYEAHLSRTHDRAQAALRKLQSTRTAQATEAASQTTLAPQADPTEPRP